MRTETDRIVVRICGQMQIAIPTYRLRIEEDKFHERNRGQLQIECCNVEDADRNRQNFCMYLQTDAGEM